MATDQGLGYLARDFVENLGIDKVLVKPHSSRTNHYDWYPNRVESVDELLADIDTLIAFETFFDWSLIARARKMQIKTVLMPMYECTPNPLPYNPDLILSPSLLDSQYYLHSFRINVPVAQKWRLRKKAKVFVHNAGNGGLGGRNGTRELLAAMKFVKWPIKLIIRTQSLDIHSDDPRVEIRRGQAPKEELYNEGDVFIFPEKFNGLSLPLQEAFASGMLVMGSNRFPMNTWLPNDPLIPVAGYKKERIAVEFDSAILEPTTIAASINSWYNCDITKYSKLGKEWAEKNSWKRLRKIYLELLSK